MDELLKAERHGFATERRLRDQLLETERELKDQLLATERELNSQLLVSESKVCLT